jgi:hypothetical protein
MRMPLKNRINLGHWLGAGLLLSVGMGLSSCEPGAIPSAPSASYQGTVLSPGDVAVVGFTTHGSQNDQFAFVLLKNVVTGTSVNLSDMNWDGSEFSESDGGVIVWTADKAYPAGTVVQALNTLNGGSGSTRSYAVNIYSAGSTATNVTSGSQSAGYGFNASSPIQVTTVANTGGGLTGLASAGDQILIYQGSTALGASASAVTFISGFTYGAAWLMGTPVPADATGADSYLPPGLTDGQNALAVTLAYGNGGYYDCANGTTGTQAALESLFNHQANWSLSMAPVDLPVPVLSCAITVQ